MGRSKHTVTLQLEESIFDIAQEVQPITIRGICYKLFSVGLLANMSRASTQKVSRLCRDMREAGVLPWHWVVDDGRPVQQVASWDDPTDFLDKIVMYYRKDFWAHQPYDVRLWSEKNTIAGVLAPVLDEYGIPFQAHKGFSSATAIHNAAVSTHTTDRPTVFLYLGDYDPSGLYMSEVDLIQRLDRYGANCTMHRVALMSEDLPDLPSFSVADKKTDTRYRWWVENDFGSECWELDAMSPDVLRARVEEAILGYLDVESWERCLAVQQAEAKSMQDFLQTWHHVKGQNSILCQDSK